MSKYRKRPIVIEATQWFKNGDHPNDATETFVTDASGSFQGEGHVVRYYRDPDDQGERECSLCGKLMHWHGWIDTLEGGHNVCPGDWIITGIKGEHYPVKDDIFRATYDEVGNDAAC